MEPTPAAAFSWQTVLKLEWLYQCWVLKNLDPQHRPLFAFLKVSPLSLLSLFLEGRVKVLVNLRSASSLSTRKRTIPSPESMPILKELNFAFT